MFLSSFWNEVSYTAFENLYCSFLKWRQNSHFCALKFAYMLFVITGFLIQILLFVILSLNQSFIWNFSEFIYVAIRNKGETLIFIGQIFKKWQSDLPSSIYKFTFQNSVSISVSYFESVIFQFPFPFSRQRVHSKTQR